MKGEMRRAYQAVARVGNLGLCNFCKYAEFDGSYCDSTLYCNHTLPKISENATEVWFDGNDCWAFRACYDLQTAGIIASISAEGLIPHFGRGEWVGVIPRQPIV